MPGALPGNSGPFEMVDAIGLLHSPRKIKKKAARFPPFLKSAGQWPHQLLRSSKGENLGHSTSPPGKTKRLRNAASSPQTLQRWGREVRTQLRRSLIDLGDGVVAANSIQDERHRPDSSP